MNLCSLTWPGSRGQQLGPVTRSNLFEDKFPFKKKTYARFNFVEGNNKFGYFWIGRDRLNVENDAMTTKMPQSSFSKNLKLAIGPGAWNGL